MGQSIVVTEKPSSNRGVVRFETNRALTGMGHERYVAGQEVQGQRPPDELARRLLRKESVAGVQVNGNMVTVDLNKGYDTSGLVEIIENLYRFYPDVDEVVAGSPEAVAAEALAPEEAAELSEEPAADEDPAAASEEPAAEEAPADEPAAEDPPAEEPAAEDETPAEEPAAEEETPAEEPAEEPAAEAQEPAAEDEPAEEPAAAGDADA